MKFREKTYLVTLVLFLVILNAGIFSLAFYTYENNVSAAKDIAAAEEKVIAEAFSNDIAYLSREESIKRVMESYGTFYQKKGIYLSFTFPEGEAVSTLPAGLTSPKAEHTKEQRTEDGRYYLISQVLEKGEIALVYAKDIGYLDQDFSRLAAVFVPVSLLASLFLALCLFFVLRKLASPLERLRAVAEEMTKGNFAVRAPDTGKDEFSLLGKDFNRMAQHVEDHTRRLEESAAIKQRMLDDLAHEMRTPLTSIRGYAEFLQIANIPEEEKLEAADYIISQAERLEKIAERLLDEAFIRENGISGEETSLGDLLRGVEKMLLPKAEALGVKLSVEIREVTAFCDPLLMEMLLSNLAENAMKACRQKQDGRVTLACRGEEGGILLSVTDNGAGMTKEQLARITQPFYRTDRSRSRSEGGTGLGLSLCAKIADAHGAELTFRSAVGEGTVAEVRLGPKNLTNP